MNDIIDILNFKRREQSTKKPKVLPYAATSDTFALYMKSNKMTLIERLLFLEDLLHQLKFNNINTYNDINIILKIKSNSHINDKNITDITKLFNKYGGTLLIRYI